MRHSPPSQTVRALRRLMTDAERRLWRALRHRQVQGCRFRRQHPVGPYITDFACLERRLIVEIDGSQHAASATDPARDAYLRRHGFRVLRVWDHDVLANFDGVCAVIIQLLERRRERP